MGVNKYASTFPMASCNMKTCNHRKKRGVKIWKYAIVFASTQLRITRLHKYPIDPKAYLGRWPCLDFLGLTRLTTKQRIRCLAQSHNTVLQRGLDQWPLKSSTWNTTETRCSSVSIYHYFLKSVGDIVITICLLCYLLNWWTDSNQILLSDLTTQVGHEKAHLCPDTWFPTMLLFDKRRLRGACAASF